jgi:hypothetical protein
MKKKIKTPIFELKVNSWNKRTPREQDKAVLLMINLMGDLTHEYKKTGISDEFTAMY